MMDWLRRYFGAGENTGSGGRDADVPAPRQWLNPNVERGEARDAERRQQEALARARGYPTIEAMVAAEPGAVDFPMRSHTTQHLYPSGRVEQVSPYPGILPEDFAGAASWLAPLENPSRLVGAAISGQHPMDAPTAYEALVQRGAPEWVAGLTELLAVPDPLFAGKVRDMFLLASIIPGFKGFRAALNAGPEELTQAAARFLPEGRFGDLEDLSRFPELQEPELLEQAAERIAREAQEVRARAAQLGIDVEPTLNRLEAAAARAQLQADAMRYREGKPVVDLRLDPEIDGILDQLADIGLQGGVIPSDFQDRAMAVTALEREFAWLDEAMSNHFAGEIPRGAGVPADSSRVQRLILAIQALGDERSVALRDIPMHPGAERSHYLLDDLVNSPIHNSIYNESKAIEMFARAGTQAGHMETLSDEIVGGAAPQIMRMWEGLDQHAKDRLEALITEQAFPNNLSYASLDRPAIELQTEIEQLIREGSAFAQSRMMLLGALPPPRGVQQALDDLYAKGLPTKDAIAMMQDADPLIQQRGISLLEERLVDAGYSLGHARDTVHDALRHYRANPDVSAPSPLFDKPLDGPVPPAAGSNAMREAEQRPVDWEELQERIRDDVSDDLEPLDPNVPDGPRKYGSASEAIDESLLWGTAMNRVHHYAGIKPDDLRRVFEEEGEEGVRMLIDDIDWTGQSYDTVEEGYEALFAELRRAADEGGFDPIDLIEARALREWSQDDLRRWAKSTPEDDLSDLARELAETDLRDHPTTQDEYEQLLRHYRSQFSEEELAEAVVDEVLRRMDEGWNDGFLEWARGVAERVEEPEHARRIVRKMIDDALGEGTATDEVLDALIGDVVARGEPYVSTGFADLFESDLRGFADSLGVEFSRLRDIASTEDGANRLRAYLADEGRAPNYIEDLIRFLREPEPGAGTGSSLQDAARAMSETTSEVYDAQINARKRWERGEMTQAEYDRLIRDHPPILYADSIEQVTPYVRMLSPTALEALRGQSFLGEQIEHVFARYAGGLGFMPRPEMARERWANRFSDEVMDELLEVFRAFNESRPSGPSETSRKAVSDLLSNSNLPIGFRAHLANIPRYFPEDALDGAVAGLSDDARRKLEEFGRKTEVLGLDESPQDVLNRIAGAATLGRSGVRDELIELMGDGPWVDEVMRASDSLNDIGGDLPFRGWEE